MMDCGLKDNVFDSLPDSMVLEYEKHNLSNVEVMLFHAM